jgi:hypothetical protein
MSRKVILGGTTPYHLNIRWVAITDSQYKHEFQYCFKFYIT